MTPSKNSLTSLIARRQAALNIDDAELARSLGFEHPKVIALIKQSTMRMPINKIVKLAEALGERPADLLRLAMSESCPDLLRAVENILNPLRLTESEVRLVEGHRKLSSSRA
jgi:hypothetical protein